MELNQEFNQSAFMEKVRNPILQAVTVFTGVIGLMLILKIIIWSGSAAITNRACWIIAGCAIHVILVFL